MCSSDLLTVYDMIHETYPDLFDQHAIEFKNKRILCEKAAKIIAIRENTKKDIVRLCNIDPDKIEVIYLGQSFKKANKHTIQLPEKYILFTGSRWGYKNFKRFAEAFSRLPSDYELVCTGAPFTEEEIQLFQQLNMSQRVHAFFVSDQQLSELYSRALLFVFPSEYEGFGIPVLESMVCGCPVVLSDASSFPEVAGDAGAYFDPLSVDSIYETMHEVLFDEMSRQTLIEKGYQQAEQFSWEKMAKQTLYLYKTIL